MSSAAQHCECARERARGVSLGVGALHMVVALVIDGAVDVSATIVVDPLDPRRE